MCLQGVHSLLTDLVVDLTTHPCVTAGTDAFVAGHSKGFQSLRLPHGGSLTISPAEHDVGESDVSQGQAALGAACLHTVHAFTPCMHAFVEDAHH